MPEARTRRSSALLTIPWLVGLVFALALAWLPLEVSITHFLYEDYFYYLKVAEHILEGNGATFDGQAKTNGFHPAWMILITVIRAVSGHIAAIHVGLTLAAFLHVAQAALIYAVVSRLASRCVAYCAAVLFLLNYRIIAANLCGLETPLASFALLGVILFLVDKRGGLDTLRDAVLLGILLGLAVLSRFDLALFVLFVGGWTLLSGAQKKDLSTGGRTKATLIGSTVTAAVCVLTTLPWFIWSFKHSGVLLPNSHAALSVLRAAKNLSFSEVVQGKVFGTAWWLTDTANALGLWPTAAPGDFFTNLSALLVVLTVLAFGVGLWRLLRSEPETLRLLAVLFIYAVVHVGYYVVTLRAEVRYLLPFVCIMFIVGAVLADRLIEHASSSKTRDVLLGVAMVLLVNGFTSGLSAWRKHHGATRTHADHGVLLEVARWLEDNVSEGTVVGAWNAGVLSYFSGRHVVNLDGVINDEVIDYNRRRAIHEYIEMRNIRLLADGESQIESYMGANSSLSEWQDAYEPKARFREVVILERRR